MAIPTPKEIFKMNTGQLNQLTAANKANQNYEWIDWVLYSIVPTGAASASNVSLNFFQDSLATVTRALTNMETPGQLNSGKIFQLYQIDLRVFNTDGKALAFDAAVEHPTNIILASSYVDFYVDNKKQLDLPGTVFHDAIDKVNTTTTVAQGSINTMQYKSFKMKSMIQINPQTNFIFTVSGINTPAVGAGTSGYSATKTAIGVYFRGMMARIKG